MTALGQPTFATRLQTFASDIKLSHSVFALPWAILATFLAAQSASPQDVGPGWVRIGLIVLCMVLARTVAMGANRLFDARLDALNPRTSGRALPSGRLSKAFVIGIIAACSIGFIGATSLFGVFYKNWIPLAAAVPVLVFISAYPFLKRFSRLCHYYLGAALALAPVCAWVAIAGSISVEPLWMALAVLLWTAGFDILYACQDYQSDRATGVVSVPARFGIANALWIARLTHAGCVLAMIGLLWASALLSVLFATGIGIAIVLLIIEHLIVRPTNLTAINLAFFTINGIISLVLGALGVIDTLI